MIAIVHSIYSQSVHALVLNTGLMDNDAERYCIFNNILNTCENVNIELCTRFLSYNNYFCRTISVCNARSTITMFPM